MTLTSYENVEQKSPASIFQPKELSRRALDRLAGWPGNPVVAGLTFFAQGQYPRIGTHGADG